MPLTHSEITEKDFDCWLKDKLIHLNTDDEIFTPYIKGILDSDENIDEKREGLIGILSEIIDNGIDDLCSEILDKWSGFMINNTVETQKICTDAEIDEKLSRLMGGSQLVTQSAPTKLNSEQQKLKEAILANYSKISDEDGSDPEECPTASASAESLEKNRNVESAFKAEKIKRDKEKEESQKRKEKDKEDRTKQKMREEDRKDKEKKRTQKGERRR